MGGESWREGKALEAFLKCLYYGKYSDTARRQSMKIFYEVWLQSLSEALCNTLGYYEGALAATEFPFKEGRSICKLPRILMVGVFIKKEFGQQRIETC